MNFKEMRFLEFKHNYFMLTASKWLVYLVVHLFICQALAHGPGDPVFLSSAVMANNFSTAEMKPGILRLKYSPLKFDMDVSKAHSEDPSNNSGYGFMSSGVLTKFETENGFYGLGGSLSYFQGTGKTTLLMASSPLERFMGDHKVSGFIATFTANMDPTKKISWFNLPMFIGVSLQKLSSQSNGTFTSVDRDNSNPTMPFGTVTIDQRSDFTGLGVYAGLGPQFVIDPDWFTVTPFTTIIVPINRQSISTTMDDQRFDSRVPKIHPESLIPVVGVEFAIPRTNSSFLWIPSQMTQGASVFTLSWSQEISI